MGIFISTEASDQAEGEQLSRSAVQESINYHAENNKYFKELAQAHEVDDPDLESQELLKNKFEQFNEKADGLVTLHSQSGMITRQ